MCALGHGERLTAARRCRSRPGGRQRWRARAACSHSRDALRHSHRAKAAALGLQAAARLLAVWPPRHDGQAMSRSIVRSRASVAAEPRLDWKAPHLLRMRVRLQAGARVLRAAGRAAGLGDAHAALLRGERVAGLAVGLQPVGGHLGRVEVGRRLADLAAAALLVGCRHAPRRALGRCLAIALLRARRRHNARQRCRGVRDVG